VLRHTQSISGSDPSSGTPFVAFEETMKVKWFASFVRFINRDPLLRREIEQCNQYTRNNERFAPRERWSSAR